MTTRLPCRCPTRPLLKPGTTWARLNATGVPRLKDSSKVSPVRPSTPW